MKALRMLGQRDARRCPRCQIAVEKDGGCDSPHCRFYFSWEVAEPVLAVIKASNYNLKTADPVSWPRELCEIDLLAAEKAARETTEGGEVPVRQPYYVPLFQMME
ncbi:hypothetical protein GQ43DRAFT_473102 [Delitschia confertaspora ATCC 74209]|uniref:Uncharacterized protein n=1 Tax=Delitschia confertaspora ATCC 74209 TaxID=1513339 RepID=A0A9P4JMV3_9PLEO|nr:hypothetical protein GQ43DRAFT_473102 [Delitschia confertaspora ATCC 74209]